MSGSFLFVYVFGLNFFYLINVFCHTVCVLNLLVLYASKFGHDDVHWSALTFKTTCLILCKAPLWHQSSSKLLKLGLHKTSEGALVFGTKTLKNDPSDLVNCNIRHPWINLICAVHSHKCLKRFRSGEFQGQKNQHLKNVLQIIFDWFYYVTGHIVLLKDATAIREGNVLGL